MQIQIQRNDGSNLMDDDGSQNLLITMLPDDREELQSAIESNDKSSDSIWAELIEEYSCNGSYTYFNAGDGNPYVGLSSAPCIAESVDIDDAGEISIDGDFWFFDNYALENELQTLADTGKVIFSISS